MRSNPLRHPIDALRFAVDFAQADLMQLKPADYLALIKRVDALINRDGPSPGSASYVLDDKTLEVLQQGALELLAAIARQGTFTVAGDLVLTFWGVRDGSRIRVLVGGTPLDRLLYQLIRILEAVGADRLMACPASDCQRIFVKVTKKRFCSQRCQSRIYMRQLRAEERAERDALTAKAKRGRDGKTTRTR